MKEFYQEKKLTSFCELIDESAKKFGRRTAFKVRQDETHYRKITYRELKDRFYSLSEEFLSIGLEGERIAVIGKNRWEWALCYLAAATVGVVVPLDKELSAEDAANFIKSAGCTAVCADDRLCDTLAPAFMDTVVFRFSEVDAISSRPCADESKVRAIPVSRDQMKVLLFTSGTTGNEKGVCLSENNILSDIHSTVRMVKVKKSDVTLSVLPLHHTYECTLNCLLVLSRGACITYADSLVKVAKNIVEYRPSVLVVVPALLEVLERRIRSSVIEQCPAKYKRFFHARPFAEAMRKLPPLVRKVICMKVKQSLGGRLRLVIVGAADLKPEIVENLSSLGIRTLQGYGLTECAPLLAGNSDFWFDANTTGRAIPGVELKIENPNEEGMGEIIARGENIMLGYFRDEKATQEAMRGGWFHTGDIGTLDQNGFLTICGRKKNVIVTENGKNIYPEELEARLLQFPEVEEVLVLEGEERGKPCVKAKILPSMLFMQCKYNREPSREEILETLNEVIEEVNCKVPAYKRIRLLEVLTSALEKTTTQKIRRCGANLC